MTTSGLHEFSRRGTKVHRLALIDGPNMSNQVQCGKEQR